MKIWRLSVKLCSYFVTIELQQKMVDILVTQMLQWSNGALMSGPSWLWRWQIIEFQMFSPLIFSLSRGRSYFVLATKLLNMWLFHIEVSTQVLYYEDHHTNLGGAISFSVWWALQRKRFSWKPEHFKDTLKTFSIDTSTWEQLAENRLTWCELINKKRNRGGLWRNNRYESCAKSAWLALH